MYVLGHAVFIAIVVIMAYTSNEFLYNNYWKIFGMQHFAMTIVNLNGVRIVYQKGQGIKYQRVFDFFIGFIATFLFYILKFL